MVRLVGVTVFASALLLWSPAEAATVGQIDTFQSGTVEGWVAGGGPVGQVPPVLPHVVLSGGPGGVGDAYLELQSSGGAGPGSRLTTFNILGQWADNYLTNGITAITMDLINLGTTDLTIRLEFENPFAGGDFAVTTSGFTLAANSGWQKATFAIGLGSFTSLGGTIAGALAQTDVLRILHATGPNAAEVVAGVLGVDNITAVPEPGTILLSGLALATLALRKRLRA